MFEVTPFFLYIKSKTDTVYQVIKHPRITKCVTIERTKTEVLIYVINTKKIYRQFFFAEKINLRIRIVLLRNLNSYKEKGSFSVEI